MFRMNSIRGHLIAVAAVACIGAFPDVSQASFFHDVTALNQSELFAQQFPQVGFVTTVEGSTLSGGSGVIIADDWLLTAAHVLTRPGDPFGDALDEIRFRTGIDPFGPSGPDHFRLADAWFVHPESSLTPIDGVDLALIHLSDPITDIAPVSLYNGPVAAGMEFHSAGYGQPGSVATGLLPFDWQRRAGSNSISHISGDGYIRSQFNSMANGGLADERLGTDLDSGGGVFFDVNGQFELFALMSGGSGSPGYGAWNADMPIQPHLGWIGSTMASLPEPTTGMLFMIASGLLLGRRRRGQSHC